MILICKISPRVQSGNKYTKKHHKPISHIAIISYKPIFYAILYHTYTTNSFSMLPVHQRAPQTYFQYCNNVIQTHFPCKSLSYPHHVLPESITNLFFYMKNEHHILPPPHPTAILTTMRMKLPFVSNFSHTLHISAPIAATKPTMASLLLTLFDVGTSNVNASPNLVFALGIGRIG